MRRRPSGFVVSSMSVLSGGGMGDKANVSRAGARGQRVGDGESKRPGLVPRVEWCECEVYQMRCITWVVPMVASRQAGLISRLGAFPYSRWFGCAGMGLRTGWGELPIVAVWWAEEYLERLVIYHVAFTARRTLVGLCGRFQIRDHVRRAWLLVVIRQI